MVYEGRCPHTGRWLQLPRTAEAEGSARQLMAELACDPEFFKEGKMYGVLVAQTRTQTVITLKGFSGLLRGASHWEGWVPPIPGREQVALMEAQTLSELDQIKAEILRLQALPEREVYAQQRWFYEEQYRSLLDLQQRERQERQQQRQELLDRLEGVPLTEALAKLDRQSQQAGTQRRKLKQAHQRALADLAAICSEADDRIRDLKQQRKRLSRQLQAQMHEVYRLTNFAGDSITLQALQPQGLPTGTGDCAAPKLLHYAATHGLQPLGMAEFWWGTDQGDKQVGQFYGACRDRCQPIMGFLLSGVTIAESLTYSTPVTSTPVTSTPVSSSANVTPKVTANVTAIVGSTVSSTVTDLAFNEDQKNLTVDGGFQARPSHLQLIATDFNLNLLYEDEDVIAIDKPSGLLSLPGRTFDRQDSVFSRLRCQYADGDRLHPVHRLDQQTSGILLIARNEMTSRVLSQQFRQRQVHKSYEAIVTGSIMVASGTIALPLWGDPNDRPRQQVDWHQGKASYTDYRVLSTHGGHSRIQFHPLTGRTHQLRVHSAHPQGLDAPILGDRLYGSSREGLRLHLHATHLDFTHPTQGVRIQLFSPPSF